MLSAARSNRRLQQVAARRGFSSAAPKREPSLLDGIFRQSTMQSVPLTDYFPGLPRLTEGARVAPNLVPRITALENGMRVATTESASPLCSMGVFINAGSRHEQPDNNGVTNFLEHVAFKSTKSRSDFRLVRDMLKIGANVMCSTSREHTVYSADCLKDHAPQVLHTLADVVQNQAFMPSELAEAAAAYKAENAERAQQADVQVMESVHAAAYFNNTLGHSLYSPTGHLDSFTPEVLHEWTRTYFTPKRVVVGAVGVDHDKFVELCNAYFRNMPADVLPATPPKAEYTGGDVRVHNKETPDGLCHFALAFETASWTHKDLVPMCVLQTMMGGGGSFSAGGPGKGMYSRLYERVLNRHGWVESATSFNSIFEDSALFGIYGTAQPAHAAQLADVISSSAQEMTGKVDGAELSRAKNQLKSAVHMQLETRALQLEDLGRQVMVYGKVQSAKEMCSQIDAVTEADVQRVATAMLKTTPAVASFGDLSYLPRYDTIAKRFQA